MKKHYKRLPVLVHPDKVLAIQPRCADRCMKVLTRATQQAESEVRYIEIDEDMQCGKVVLLPAFIAFSKTSSERALSLDKMERAAQGKQDNVRETQRQRECSNNEEHEKASKGASDVCSDSEEDAVRERQARAWKQLKKEREEAARAAQLQKEREERARAAQLQKGRAREKRERIGGEMASHLRAVLENDGTDKDGEDEDSMSNGERNDDEDEVEKCITPPPSRRVFCRFRGTEDDPSRESSADKMDEENFSKDGEHSGVFADVERMEECIDGVQFEDGGDDVGSEAGRNLEEDREVAGCLEIDSEEDVTSDEDFDRKNYIAIECEEEEEDVEERAADPIPDDIDKKTRRTLQKRQSKRRTMIRAKDALRADRLPAMTWKPRPILDVQPKMGIALKGPWRCEQLIRAHTANLEVQRGVNIMQNNVKVRTKCRTDGCHATFVFDWQPRTSF